MCFGKLTLYDYEGGGFSTNKVYRFTENGQPDNSFNSTGQVTIFKNYFLNREPQLNHLLLQPDEKFLFYDEVEWEGNDKICRYLKNGKIDKSFGDEGSINLSEYGMYMTISDMFLQKDLKITALGTYYYDPQNDTASFYIFRYNNDVQIADESFVASGNKADLLARKDISIKLSPNPASNVLNISGVASNMQLSIINSEGKTITQATASSSVYNWNIQNLVPGNYFLIVTRGNNKIATLQFVKQ